MDLQAIANSCDTKYEFAKKLNIVNGNIHRKLSKFIEGKNIDMSHFRKNGNKKPVFEERICPVCEQKFTINKNHEKVTCSYSCSNKYFRTGKNNGMYSGRNYRTICFSEHKKQCIICGENKIVAVHHYDFDHTNNDENNLVPLCPTHHCYVHSNHCGLIKAVIDAYINSLQEVISQ